MYISMYVTCVHSTLWLVYILIQFSWSNHACYGRMTNFGPMYLTETFPIKIMYMFTVNRIKSSKVVTIYTVHNETVYIEFVLSYI